MKDEDLKKISRENIPSMVKGLVNAIFSQDELANCSRTGKAAQNGRVKPKLNETKQCAIIDIVVHVRL